MGIKGLSKLCLRHAPESIISNRIEAYDGKMIAVDAPISVYRYLTAIRARNGDTLRNKKGEPTSHLAGIFRRSIKFLESGIEPVYVFDGKPPDMKKLEHMKRETRRERIRESLISAMDRDDQEAVESLSRMTVRVSKEQLDQCILLLKHMGMIVIVSPGEAEAQCSKMAKDGQVFGVASEDSDSLVFGAPRLLRNLVSNKGKNDPVIEMNLEKALDGLKISMEQFIDLGILLGCDYCNKISGIGPETALKFIREYKNIETIIEHIEKDNKENGYKIPDSWDYEKARGLFKFPALVPKMDDLRWEYPNKNEIIRLLVDENQFSSTQVLDGIKRLIGIRSRPKQRRLLDFFKPTES